MHIAIGDCKPRKPWAKWIVYSRYSPKYNPKQPQGLFLCFTTQQKHASFVELGGGSKKKNTSPHSHVSWFLWKPQKQIAPERHLRVPASLQAMEPAERSASNFRSWPT